MFSIFMPGARVAQYGQSRSRARDAPIGNTEPPYERSKNLQGVSSNFLLPAPGASRPEHGVTINATTIACNARVIGAW